MGVISEEEEDERAARPLGAGGGSRLLSGASGRGPECDTPPLARNQIWRVSLAGGGVKPICFWCGSAVVVGPRRCSPRARRVFSSVYPSSSSSGPDQWTRL